MATATSFRNSEDYEIFIELTGHYIIKNYHEDFIRIISKQVYVDEKIMAEAIENVLKITAGRKVKVHSDPSALKGMSRAARIMTMKAAENFSARYAIITKNLLTRTLGSIMLKIDNPDLDIKLFDSSEKAIEWLKKG